MNLKTELMQFSGTEHYYAHNFGGMTYTDGVKYFADKVGAYWFLDIVSTELMLPADKEGFISIHLVSADSKAVAKADDGNYNVFWTRKIEYTDCPAGDWQFYLTNRVLMLPSEY